MRSRTFGTSSAHPQYGCIHPSGHSYSGDISMSQEWSKRETALTSLDESQKQGQKKTTEGCAQNHVAQGKFKNTQQGSMDRSWIRPS